MRTYRITRDNDRPLEIIGDRIAQVSTGRGHKPRWTELTLYRTREGQWVAQCVGCTTVEGEIDRHSAWVAATQQEIETALGEGPLAAELYQVAGWRGVERIQ
jgi:hypothetical protein